MEKNRYNHLNSYLKDKFGSRTLKVCIDGGFTCPNRDGTVATGGCIFCGSMGAGDLIKYRTDMVLKSIESQVTGFLGSYRGERAEKFIAYFQSFTNTYDTVENLKLKYDTALSASDKFVGLEVATRPDCINEDIVKLLASYKDKYFVCVELGLQTANDYIGRVVNRGYTTSDFVAAVKLLKKYDIDVVAHIMIGLPGETERDIADTIDIVNKTAVDGVKIHSTFVMKDTGLEEMLNMGEYAAIEREYYVDMVAKIISNLNSNIIIHRITADPPKEKLVCPEWTTRKKIVMNSINSRLDQLDIYQGDKKYNFN